MVVTTAELYGRAKEQSISADLTLDETVKLWFINATAGSLKVKMPDARKLKKGGCVLMVCMRTGSSAVTIADNGGNAITTSDGTSTLAALTRGLVLLIDNSTANGSWAVKKDAITHATNPIPVEFLYVAGGTNTTGSQPLKVRRYDHQLDSWLVGTNKSFDCKEGGGFRIGSLGVWTGNNVTSKVKVETYDPDVWTVKADAPRQHESMAAASVGSAALKGYLIGGITSGVNNNTDEYTLSGDTWALRTSTPIDLKAVGYGVSDGTYIYALWGTAATSTDQGNVYRYDPSANVYAAMTSSPSPYVHDFAAARFGRNIVKVGGRSPNSEQVDLYDIDFNVWVKKLVFPIVAAPQQPLAEAMCAAEDVPILCGGSRGAVNNVKDVWRYFAVTDLWVQKADMLTNGPGTVGNQAVAIAP